MVGAFAYGHKEVLAVTRGYRESTESRAAALPALTARGLSMPPLVIADAHLGIWAALRQVWPEAAEQRCWNHKIVNVLDQLPQKVQAEARVLLTPMPSRRRGPRPCAGGRPSPSAIGAVPEGSGGPGA